MPVLRDLITRFSFDVNEKDIHKYDKTVGNMTKKALKLGAIFGGVFSVKSLADSGRTTAQTAENLKAVADVNFNYLQTGLSGVKQSLEETRKGASAILTDRSLNMLGVDWIDTFGNGKKELKSFLVLLESASKLAFRTREPLEDIFAGFKNAAVSGDLSVFQKVSGIDRTQTQFLENMLANINPNELGGEVGRKQNLSAISKLISKARSTQDKTLINLSDPVYEASQARLRIEGLKQKASELAYKQTAPISENVNEGLIESIKIFKSLDEKSFFGKTDKQGRSDASKSWDSLGSDINNWFSGFVDKHNKEYGNNKAPSNSAKIQVNANINVVSPDPVASGKEVKKQLEKIIIDASNQKIKTEDNRP